MLAVGTSPATQVEALTSNEKSICPANIVFFHPEGNSAEDIPPGFLTRPYIKGYVYSRRSENVDARDTYSTLSETMPEGNWMDDYGHPATLGSGDGRAVFKKTFDLYSLGLVLLEIRLWRRSSLGNERIHENIVQPKQIQKRLCQKYLMG